MYSGKRKFVALVVLVWALFDLTVPGVCQTDFPDFRSSQPISVSAQSSVSHQQQSQTAAEDDCFCCCSHVAPTTPVTMTGLAIAVAEWPPFLVEQPRASSSSLYHPPRS